MYKIMERNEIELLGASLRRINQKLLKKNGSIKRIWYQGEESYFDMFLEIQNDEIIWFQFTLRGKVLLWEQQNPVMQTGITNESGTVDISYYAASKLIKLERKTDRSFIKLVHSILQTRAGEDIFDCVLKLFKE